MQIEKKKDIIKGAFLFAILFLIVFVLELITCKNGIGDDKVYARALDEQSLKVFLEGRYRWWSSRVFIEFIMMPFQVYWQKAWYVVNALVSASIVMYSGLLISKRKEIIGIIAILLAMIFLIPVNAYGGSGWITTTTNYLWVLFYSLISMYPLIKECRGERINLFLYILSLLFSFFAMNNEQTAALLLGILVAGFAYLIVAKKKFSLWLIPILAVNIYMIRFDLRSMGNAARMAYETEKYMPEFAGFSVLEKILNGFTNAGYVYVNHAGKEYALWALAIVLAAKGFIFNKKLISRIVSLGPIIILAIPKFIYFLFRKGIWKRFLRFMELIWDNRLYTSTDEGFLAKTQVAFYALVILLFLIVICICAKNAAEGYAHSMAFLAAICSACILGFSPTILASGERIFFFGDYLIVIIVVRLTLDIINSARHKKR